MIPLFSSGQIRNADSYAINELGIPGIVLMENAAQSIYDAIHENLESLSLSDEIGIICGKGNNGGDGFALARKFLVNGYNVRVISLAHENELKGDALTNFKITKKLIENYPYSNIQIFKNIRDLNNLSACSLIIDAILGTGSRGILDEPVNSIVAYLNNLDAFKVAVDIPTGLDVDKAAGEIIFNSHLTVSLAELKRGLFYSEGYASSGQVIKGSIGLDPAYFDNLEINDYLIEPEDALVGLPLKKKNAHKYSAGKVLVIAGSGVLPGAAFLTANSVLEAGAGACLLAFPQSIKLLAQQKLNESIVVSYEDNSDGILKVDNIKQLHEKILWADTIAIGPGLGRADETRNAVIEILSKYGNKQFVLDADSIFALKNYLPKQKLLSGQILTPHHGEFAEMLNIPLHELKSDLLEISREFAVENSCYLVLKGAPTIICNPEGESFINSTGNAGMAKFGTGDVLTGVLSSFISQSKDLEPALISAVYIHSLAADLEAENKTEFGFTASDISGAVPSAIKFLINSFV